MKYKILQQSFLPGCERDFWLEDTNGEHVWVDFYSDGELEPPKNIDFGEWLSSFVGKEIEIEKLVPRGYFTSGKIKIITNQN